ncbi:MAG TPA: hypothetical protein VGK81_12595, partial [Anaerolineae bacterium]
LFAFTLTLQSPLDPDLWWHLRVGQDFWSGIFPFRDIYTWSMPGYLWVDHEWLTDALMFQVYRLTGLIGLGLIFSAITLAAYVLATRTGAVIQRHSQASQPLGSPAAWRLGWALALVGLLVNLDIIGTRPQMITLLGFAAVNYCVWQYLTGERKSLWLLIPGFWVWANLHGGFTFGLLLLGLTLGALILARLIPRLSRLFPFQLIANGEYTPRISHISLVLAGTVGASLVNPYTYRVYEEALRTGLDRLARATISEWRPVNFQQPSGLIIGAFLLLFILWLLWTNKQRNAWYLLLLPVFLYLAMTSVRHVAPLVIFMLPWVYTNAGDEPLVQRLAGTAAEKWFGIRRAPLVYYAFNAVLLLIALSALGLRTVEFVANSTNMDALAQRSNAPLAAVGYLKANSQPDDLIFNEYSWGGYLIWNLPEHKVYIDGRMPSWQTPDQHILEDYVHISDLAPDWMDTLLASHATLVLADKMSHLGAALSQVATFQLVYQDDVAVIYRRR